jgi:hypothetical protein
MTQEQIDVAMLGCPRINEEMKSLEITLSESMAFKVRLFLIKKYKKNLVKHELMSPVFSANGRYLIQHIRSFI